jgi:hypothetical protein
MSAAMHGMYALLMAVASETTISLAADQCCKTVAVNAALHCSPAGTSTNLNYGRDPIEQSLIFMCPTCGPMYEMVNYGDGRGYMLGSRGYPGGYSQDGAARCTLCNATGQSGYSWRGLACNAT